MLSRICESVRRPLVWTLCSVSSLPAADQRRTFSMPAEYVSGCEELVMEGNNTAPIDTSPEPLSVRR